MMDLVTWSPCASCDVLTPGPHPPPLCPGDAQTMDIDVNAADVLYFQILSC